MNFRVMNPTRAAGWGLFLLAVGLLGGCAEGTGSDMPIHLRAVEMKLGGKAFTLEVADTPGTRETGLMRRDSMPADHGMLFVFEGDERRGFWMKNTRIPLDIIYVNAAGRVVSIKQMKAYDTSTTSSDGPAKYAVELNWGVAEGTGLRPGDRIDIPPTARDPQGL